MINMNRTSKRTLSHDDEDEMLTRSGPLSQCSQSSLCLCVLASWSRHALLTRPALYSLNVFRVAPGMGTGTGFRGRGRWLSVCRRRFQPTYFVCCSLPPQSYSEASASAAGSVEPASSYQEGSIVRARLYHIQWVDHTPPIPSLRLYMHGCCWE